MIDDEEFIFVSFPQGHLVANVKLEWEMASFGSINTIVVVR